MLGLQQSQKLGQIQVDLEHIEENKTDIKDVPSTILEGLTRKDPVDEVLVGIIGIEDYLPDTGLMNEQLRLENVTPDINNSKSLWNDYFKYKTMILSGENEKNERTNKYIFQNDVKQFLASIHTDFNQWKVEDEEFKHKALILLVFGHGHNEDGQESLVTSEGGLIPFEYIRHLGTDGLHPIHTAHSIRLFIFNVCRGGRLACIKEIKPKVRGINDIDIWKPTEMNTHGNICTLYSVPKGFAAPDHPGFTKKIGETIIDIDDKGEFDKYTLDELCMKVSKGICSVNGNWCPEFSSHNVFKIRLKKNDKPGKLKYHPLKELQELPSLKRVFAKPKQIPIDEEEDSTVEVGESWKIGDMKLVIIGCVVLASGLYGLYKFWKANSLSGRIKTFTVR